MSDSWKESAGESAYYENMCRVCGDSMNVLYGSLYN
jgi:hypothetical protein